MRRIPIALTLCSVGLFAATGCHDAGPTCADPRCGTPQAIKRACDDIQADIDNLEAQYVQLATAQDCTATSDCTRTQGIGWCAEYIVNRTAAAAYARLLASPQFQSLDDANAACTMHVVGSCASPGTPVCMSGKCVAAEDTCDGIEQDINTLSGTYAGPNALDCAVDGDCSYVADGTLCGRLVGPVGAAGAKNFLVSLDYTGDLARLAALHCPQLVGNCPAQSAPRCASGSCTATHEPPR
jgi:hypothetical protein